jgi:hypothetical protein
MTEKLFEDVLKETPCGSSERMGKIRTYFRSKIEYFPKWGIMRKKDVDQVFEELREFLDEAYYAGQKDLEDGTI